MLRVKRAGIKLHLTYVLGNRAYCTRPACRPSLVGFRQVTDRPIPQYKSQSCNDFSTADINDRRS